MSDKTLELQIKILAQQALDQVKVLSGDLKSLTAQASSFSADSKGIEQSLKRYQSEAAKAAAEMKLFGASSAEVKRQQELAKQAAVKLVESGFKPESEEVQNLVSQYKKLGEQAQSLDRANGENIKSFGDLKSAVTQTAAAAALIKTVDKIKDVAVFAMAQADAFQNARNEFGVLVGDMEAGAALFDRIKSFNDKTPFSLDTTKQAVNVLLSANVPLTQINERLTQFGNLSQGNSQKFSSYINAFSAAAAKGKVDMQVLNTYIHQGVPILDELAKGFKVEKEALVEMVSQGKVGFNDFTSALNRLTAEGGKYFGGMELGSKSLGAMQEGLKESVNSLAASYGNLLLPAAKKVLEIFTNITNAVNESPILKGFLAGAVVALTGYLAVMAVKQAALAVKTWLSYAAQMGFNASLAVTNPLLLAGIAAAAAATVAVVAYAASQQKAAEKTNSAALAAKEQADAYDKAAESARQYALVLTDLNVSGQRGILREAENQVSQAYQEIARIQQELATTPKQIREHYQNGRGGWRTVENPAYTELQKTLSSANTELNQAKANVNAVTVKMGELKTASLAAFGTEWQDKLLSGVEVLNREEEKAVGDLKAKAYSAFKDGFERNKAYIAELAALNSYYDKKREEALKKSYDAIGTTWRDTMLSSVEKLTKQFDAALKELDDRYNKSGKTAADDNAYKAERAALIAWEARERQNLERKGILEAHNLRLENYRKEWEYQRELARQEGNYAQFAEADAMTELANTQIGQLIAGADPLTMFIEALLKAVLALENVQKTLNFMDTIVEGIMSVIGPLIDGAFADIVSVLTEVGEVIGKVLAPYIGIVSLYLKTLAGILKIVSLPLHLLGAAFEWLYNEVIRPVGNGIISIINGIIGAINMIPGINIKKIEYLEAIGDTAKAIAEEMERRKEEITKLYERQKDRVRDELSAQISSIRQQYELGLISRKDYENQAERYQKAADDKLYEINKEMLAELEKIKNNTQAVLSPKQQEEAKKLSEEANKSYAEKWGETVPILGHIAGTYVDVGAAVVNGIVSLGKGIGKLFGFDTGTSFVPFDMPAMIHQGEGIIPKSFNEGIYAGDYALVGRGWSDRKNTKSSGKNSTVINISVNVEGSVIRERGLVEAIYEGISDGIKSGELEPLPA